MHLPKGSKDQRMKSITVISLMLKGLICENFTTVSGFTSQAFLFEPFQSSSEHLLCSHKYSAVFLVLLAPETSSYL